MKKVNILIVEDEPIIADDLSMSIEELGYHVCGVAASGKDALALIDSKQPDVVMLDIQLEDDITGIDVAHKIKEQYDIPYIFLTSHADSSTISDVVRTNPSGYIVKPFDDADLQTNIELALFKHGNQPKQDASNFILKKQFFVKTKQGLVKLHIDEIQVIEAYDNYAYVITKNEKHLVSSTLKSIEQKLEDHGFLRTHRSYLINLEHIDSITDDHIILGNTKVPIGKTYREELKNHISLL